MKSGLRLSTAIAAALGLYFAFSHGLHAEIADPVWRVVHFLSFFTILTNGIVVVAMIAPVAMPASKLGRFFDRPPVRTAIAGYIVVVGAVYHLLLAQLWDPRGLNLVAQVILHTLVPILFVVDWLIFVRRGETSWRSTLTALGFPLVYALWTLVHGALTGFYPYPFVDVGELGYARVLANMAGLAAVFAGMQLVFVAIDKGFAALMCASARDREPGRIQPHRR